MSPDKHTVKASKGVIGRNSSLWLYRWQPTISSKPSTEIWELRLFSCYFLYFFVFRFFVHIASEPCKVIILGSYSLESLDVLTLSDSLGWIVCSKHQTSRAARMLWPPLSQPDWFITECFVSTSRRRSGCNHKYLHCQNLLSTSGLFHHHHAI